MKFFDISVGVMESPTYPELPSLMQPIDIAQSEFQLQYTTSTGTHLIIPSKISASQLFEQIMGACRVVTLRSTPHITLKDVQSLKPTIQPGSRILFKTTNGELMDLPTINTKFATFSESAVRYLADRNLRLIGWDYLSLDNHSTKEFSATDYLLQSQIPLLMGVQLQHVTIGEYQLHCLPLKLAASVLPARAILSR